MTGDPKASEIIKRHQQLRDDRATWETHWQEVVDLVRPMAGDFTNTRYQGQRRTEKIYDSTAVEALDLLASSLHSSVTPSSQRWFSLSVSDPEVATKDAVLAWLEGTSDRMFHYLKRPEACFTTSIHEFYLDLCAFGTAIIFQEWDKENKIPVFRTFPLTSCLIDENHKGQVDTVIRSFQFSARQVLQKWPDAPTYFKEQEAAAPNKQFIFIHSVQPKGKEWESVWVSKDLQEIMHEGKYRTFPYHVARWEKVPGEMYGRSPATKCMPTIKVLNQYEKLSLQRTQMEVAPPFLVPSDGFTGPLDTSPFGINIYENGEGNKPEPMMVGGSWSMAEGKMDKLQEAVGKSFGVNYLELFRKNERQTAEEIMALNDERLRMLAPMTGRLLTEACGPLVRRLYALLEEHMLIDDEPAELASSDVEIFYVSEAAIAQERAKLAGTKRWLSEMIPLAQADPSIMEHVDLGKYVREAAITEGVTRKVIRSEEEVAERARARAEQEQMQTMMAAAEPVSKALKNVSEASQNYPSLVGA